MLVEVVHLIGRARLQRKAFAVTAQNHPRQDPLAKDAQVALQLAVVQQSLGTACTPIPE